METKNKMSNLEIPAIRDNDLRKILEHYGLSKKIDDHKLLCSGCDTPITWDNISTILVNEKELKIFCDSTECIEEISEEG